jgi:hypothetical protein
MIESRKPLFHSPSSSAWMVRTFTPDRSDTRCFHCLDAGWVMLTAENDYGELDDYFVLCRKCKKGEGF